MSRWQKFLLVCLVAGGLLMLVVGISMELALRDGAKMGVHARPARPAFGHALNDTIARWSGLDLPGAILLLDWLAFALYGSGLVAIAAVVIAAWRRMAATGGRDSLTGEPTRSESGEH